MAKDYSLRKCIDLLMRSREQTPQHQRDLIIDITRRGFLRQVIDVTLFSAFAGTCCAAPIGYTGVLPEMGDSDRTTLSPSDASFLGRQVIQNIQDEGDMLTDYDVLAYLNDVGSELVSYSPLAGQDFNFYIIKDKTINAFALPGGYICFNNGLVYVTQSEAELTSVMSHEIGHVVQHHIFRNIAVYNRSQWMALAGLIAGGLMSAVNPAAGMAAINSAQGIGIQNMLSNSRDFEREADRVGQNLMYTAGYDPHAMPIFFKRMQDGNKFNDNEALAFLRTHPVTSERISEAETRANQLAVKMRPDSASFLLIREKCRLRQIGAPEAIDFYLKAIKNKKYTNLDAQYYGLAFANYQDKKYPTGLASIAKISDPLFKTHPATLCLSAQLYAVSKNYNAATKIYEQGLSSYPSYKGLWLGQVDLFLSTKQYKLAEKHLDDLSGSYPHDSDVWARIATLNADPALNNEQKYHYALGNQQYLLNNYKAAIIQYQQALAVKKGDGTLNNVISAKVIDAQENQRNLAKYGAPSL